MTDTVNAIGPIVSESTSRSRLKGPTDGVTAKVRTSRGAPAGRIWRSKACRNPPSTNPDDRIPR